MCIVGIKAHTSEFKMSIGYWFLLFSVSKRAGSRQSGFVPDMYLDSERKSCIAKPPDSFSYTGRQAIGGMDFHYWSMITSQKFVLFSIYIYLHSPWHELFLSFSPPGHSGRKFYEVKTNLEEGILSFVFPLCTLVQAMANQSSEPFALTM